MGLQSEQRRKTDSLGRDDALKKAFLVGQMFSGIWSFLSGCMDNLEEDTCVSQNFEVKVDFLRNSLGRCNFMEKMNPAHRFGIFLPI